MDKKQFVIKQDGKLIPVSEEVYRTYYRAARHDRYLEEKDYSPLHHVRCALRFAGRHKARRR
jgi:hypothetical protein